MNQIMTMALGEITEEDQCFKKAVNTLLTVSA